MKKYDKVTLYSLSTCFWCAKIKKLLKELNVNFEEISVDLLDETEQEKVMMHLKAKDTFPIIRTQDNNLLVGYDEEAVKNFFNK